MKHAALQLVAAVGLAQALVPWHYPPTKAADARRCGGPVGFMERICGTRRYCEAFDGAPNRTDFAYDSADECFRNHGPEPRMRLAPKLAPRPLLKWLEPSPDEEEVQECQEGIRFISEARCGTQRFCEAFATLDMARTEQRFVSKEECFAAHEPRPSQPKGPLLPWTEGSDSNRLCGIYGWREKFCGTQRYCDAFDMDPEFTDGRFDNSSECYAAHMARPPRYRNKSLKMAWHDGKARVRKWCDEQHFWIIVCGTKGYCSGYDIDFNNTDARFVSTAACLDAFEDRQVWAENSRENVVDLREKAV
ncbi:hypothetical protein XA68_13233 [Ophiocordyceps unilateralis]|uniref:Uncharacterized protein n=1 Tax=Ophiocordyceps unilateralis TaxID=268505 RepID=A0A2A9PCN5_OPHUN|nr:hypothetical protein XA68_13233 [Ophiocordyceps unilateralis]